MPYTQINWTDRTNITGILEVPNLNTGGWFYTGILYMAYFVLTILFINFGFETAILTSSFITLLIGITLVYMGLISVQWGILFPAGAILFTVLYIVWSSRSDTY